MTGHPVYIYTSGPRTTCLILRWGQGSGIALPKQPEGPLSLFPTWVTHLYKTNTKTHLFQGLSDR
jgi:hypothetical protein